MHTHRPLRTHSMILALGLVAGAALATFGGALLSTPALAQVPDAAAQRNAMIRELQKSNERLGEILGVLREIRDGKTEVEEPKRP